MFLSEIFKILSYSRFYVIKHVLLKMLVFKLSLNMENQNPDIIKS